MRLLAIALLVAACGTAAPPAGVPTIASNPTLTPTDAPVVGGGTGVISFGTGFDADSLAITGAKSSFKASTKKIAWSASLLEPAGATTLTIVIASRSKSGVERILVKQDVDISDPAFDTLANAVDLGLLVDRKPGTYVMRYLRDADVLAEGTFTLVK